MTAGKCVKGKKCNSNNDYCCGAGNLYCWKSQAPSNIQADGDCKVADLTFGNDATKYTYSGKCQQISDAVKCPIKQVTKTGTTEKQDIKTDSCATGLSCCPAAVDAVTSTQIAVTTRKVCCRGYTASDPNNAKYNTIDTDKTTAAELETECKTKSGFMALLATNGVTAGECTETTAQNAANTACQTYAKSKGKNVDFACYDQNSVISLKKQDWYASNCFTYNDASQRLCSDGSDRTCCLKIPELSPATVAQPQTSGTEVCTGTPKDASGNDVMSGSSKVEYSGKCSASCQNDIVIDGASYRPVNGGCADNKLCCQASKKDEDCIKSCMYYGCKQIAPGDTCKCVPSKKVTGQWVNDISVEPGPALVKDSSGPDHATNGCYLNVDYNTVCDISCIGADSNDMRDSPFPPFSVKCNKKDKTAPSDGECSMRKGCFEWNDEDCWSKKNMGYFIGDVLFRWIFGQDYQEKWLGGVYRWLGMAADAIDPTKWAESLCNPYNNLFVSNDNKGGMYSPQGTIVGWVGAERAVHNETTYFYTVNWMVSGLKESNTYKITLDGNQMLPFDADGNPTTYTIDQGETHGDNTTSMFFSTKYFKKVCLSFGKKVKLSDSGMVVGNTYIYYGESEYCRDVGEEDYRFGNNAPISQKPLTSTRTGGTRPGYNLPPCAIRGC
jgi:hypothetical protein